jgi:hypothetical protein
VGKLIFVMLVPILSACAFHFQSYEPVLRLPPVSQRVSISVLNPEVQLTLDQGFGVPQTYQAGSQPAPGEYIVAALSREFTAGGFEVVDITQKYDVAVDIRIEKAMLASAIPMYALLVILARSAAILHVTAHVEIMATGRTFRRTFAGVRTDGYVMLLGVPISYEGDATMMLAASQQCFSDLVLGVSGLLQEVAEEDDGG